MSVLSKLLRLCGLFVLTMSGFAGIMAVHFLYSSSKVPVSLHGDGRVYLGGWDGGYVSAQGTWTIEGQDHAFPLNTSEISCVRADGFCYEAEARLSDGYLSAEFVRHKIINWDDGTLEFGSERACVSYVYVINRSTERLTGRRLKKSTTDESCRIVTLEPDLRLSFVNGFNLVRNLAQQHAPTSYSLLAAAAWLIFVVAMAVLIVRR